MSQQNALEQLANTLKIQTDQLSGLQSLSADDIRRFNQLIEQAQLKQRETLNNAIEEGLSYVPALLRGAVKAIVRG
ncbi:hypothetical protein [Agitococcus lubricus]|uniref:Uncharacterized protein n=1 Tax=Agitococcus lubricus TaxID=1077255 RepID=A0A2T5IYQ0_9GAMM|nr:hypothetical protein [Agitococcus lubricus]PTQ89143.1 hypothetical protein C8N29_10824 [Agitococcus lubricus]